MSLSFRCFVCRQSKQQLEEEQKKSLYGLENTGNISDTDSRSQLCAELRVFESQRAWRLPAARLSLRRCRAAHPFLPSSRRQQVVAVCQPLGKHRSQGDAAVGAPVLHAPRALLGPVQAFGLCPTLTREGAQRRCKPVCVDAEIRVV